LKQISHPNQCGCELNIERAMVVAARELRAASRHKNVVFPGTLPSASNADTFLDQMHPVW
jgi:hypothetical protein